MSARQSHIVAFRVDDELLRLIDSDCKDFSVSRGPWVRGIIAKHYMSSRHDELAARLDEVTSTLRELGGLIASRAQLRRVFVAILIELGAMDAQEAKRRAAKAFSKE
jgi:hypothetical protein